MDEIIKWMFNGREIISSKIKNNSKQTIIAGFLRWHETCYYNFIETFLETIHSYRREEVFIITLIKNGEVYAPGYLGKMDILIAAEKIIAMAENIQVPDGFVEINIVDADGKYVLPGFIDSHVHILGGGGEGGFKTRTPEICLTQITEAGVTTVVGCLGTDGIGRDMKTLLAKARALEEEGISTFIYTGSYRIPPITITDSIQKDLMLIDKIIGVGEIALSDHRSSYPTFDEFIKVVADARVGGMLSGKVGIVNIHIGDGKQELDFLTKMEKETDIPLKQVLPTHVNRNPSLFRKAIKYAKKGGSVDLTTSTTPKFLKEGEVKCSIGLKNLLEEGVDIRNILFSSDGQGSLPEFDDNGDCIGLTFGSVKSLYSEVRDAVQIEGIKLEEAIKVITSNVADMLKLSAKGYISVGKDADIVLVDSEGLNVMNVFAKGREVVSQGRAIVKGTFEK